MRGGETSNPGQKTVSVRGIDGREAMNIAKWWTSRFTIRGRALAQVRKGIECARSNDMENAVKFYTESIHSSETPMDVKATALFNRALIYNSTGKDPQAKVDLNQILAMKDALPEMKTAARQRLVRMQRKTGNRDIS